MVTPKMEDYLKAIYELQEGDEAVGPSAIASTLGVTRPTASTMTKKLHDRGFIEREAYKGVTLTDEGEAVALETLRHHRLLELYLTERLDYDWATVHEEADRLEHHISERLERKIAAALDDPVADPHGAPIPNPQLNPIEDRTGIPLRECEVGDEVMIEQVSDRRPEELEYLADAGLTPGAHVSVTEVAPFGMITVESADVDESIALPEELAATIRVREPDYNSGDPGDAEGVI